MENGNEALRQQFRREMSGADTSAKGKRSRRHNLIIRNLRSDPEHREIVQLCEDLEKDPDDHMLRSDIISKLQQRIRDLQRRHGVAVAAVAATSEGGDTIKQLRGSLAGQMAVIASRILERRK